MRADSALRASITAGLAGVVVAVVAAAAILTGGVASGPAWADGPGDCPPGTGWNGDLGACIAITIPGQSPGSSPSSGGGGSAPAECHNQDGSVVPCSKNGLSWWANPHWCYAEPQNPQPTADDPVWAANNITPADGQFWTCSTCAAGSNTCTGQVWWVANGTQPVDPVAVATTLQATLPYELGNAKIAPPPTYHTYISYKNWLWVPSGQWHAVTGSQSQNGATVTLTATPSYTQWDMGNGDTVSCVGPGRVWVTGMPEDAPTNCSYAYDEMKDPEGDTWTVSARINYTLAWTCTGNCGGLTGGDLPAVLAAAGNTTSITVYQRQTVVTH